jgi:hypothetical protein
MKCRGGARVPGWKLHRPNESWGSPNKEELGAHCNSQSGPAADSGEDRLPRCMMKSESLKPCSAGVPAVPPGRQAAGGPRQIQAHALSVVRYRYRPTRCQLPVSAHSAAHAAGSAPVQAGRGRRPATDSGPRGGPQRVSAQGEGGGDAWRRAAKPAGRERGRSTRGSAADADADAADAPVGGGPLPLTSQAQPETMFFIRLPLGRVRCWTSFG